jgi:hypothetical protein
VLPQETSVIAGEEAKRVQICHPRDGSSRIGKAHPCRTTSIPMRLVGAASLLRPVGAGLIASTSGPVLVVLLLPAMTTQLMMSVPPLSFNRHLFNDNRPRLDERQSLRVVMPGSEKNRANNGREDQCFF